MKIYNIHNINTYLHIHLYTYIYMYKIKPCKIAQLPAELQNTLVIFLPCQ